jgi:hypothetical protein
MLGLNKGGSASSSTTLHGRGANATWSLLFTRLPGFILVDETPIAQKWRKIRAAFATDKDVGEVFSAIDCSISGGGNPRLIAFAIMALDETTHPSAAPFSFGKWQRQFSLLVVLNKFLVVSSMYDACDHQIGQLNLLLEGSCSCDLSDVLLHRHFGHRAVPDDGALSTGARPTLECCAGWLCLADSESKLLGRKLYYSHIPLGSSKIFTWQSTIFPCLDKDALLYLASCRAEGYFAGYLGVVSTGEIREKIQLDAFKVVRALWKDNSFGLVNFQNKRSVLNSGCLLEVLNL